MDVAFQGELGAYSENAVYTFFGPHVTAKPYKSFRDVFRSVREKSVDFGLVPIENSIEGSVNPVYDLFLEFHLKVCGEVIIKIDHCLIANSNQTIDSIKTIYSHPQALAQCRKFLETLNCELISSYDTAGSVKTIKELNLASAAAIGSERAANLYNLSILARGIADNPENFTRFFALSKTDASPTGSDKTSIIFSVQHKPGSLYDILEEFAKDKVNLTKIESRPTKQRPWEYNFYVDFEGHKKEEEISRVLHILKNKTLMLKILGSYPKAKIPL